jgi:DNA polymerase-3 subunit epsilon
VRDIAGAPRFRDIVDDLLARLSGQVIVAHNAPFDVAFLQAETIRAGIAWGPVEGFCTMEALHHFGIAKSRKLHLTCTELGVPAGQEHVALDDARAAAGLMAYLGTHVWALDLPQPAPVWQLPLIPAPVLQRAAAVASVISASQEHLARYVRVPPGIGITEAAGSTYLGLLDHVVEDGM